MQGYDIYSVQALLSSLKSCFIGFQLFHILFIDGYVALKITVVIDGANEGLYNLYFHNCFDEEPTKIDMKVNYFIFK